MLTIDEIARLANVSPATVSKVLNNRSYVSAATRARVEQVIAETGYVPSQRARWLSTKRSYILGLVIPYSSDQIFADPHLLELMRGVESIADLHQYSMLLSTARVVGADQSLNRVLESDVADGGILVETLDLQPSLVLAGVAKPWAVIGYAQGVPLPTAHADDYGGALQAIRHLLELGHRRVGVISSAPRPFALEERMRGVRDGFLERGLALDERLVAVGDFSAESGERAAVELLDRSDPPSAIFALNDRMAFGVMRVALARNLHIPGDLSVIGFDDISLASLLTPMLTTVRQPGIELGAAAAHAMFALLHHDAAPESVVLPTELMVRGTTAPPPERR